MDLEPSSPGGQMMQDQRRGLCPVGCQGHGTVVVDVTVKDVLHNPAQFSCAGLEEPGTSAIWTAWPIYLEPGKFPEIKGSGEHHARWRSGRRAVGE